MAEVQDSDASDRPIVELFVKAASDKVRNGPCPICQQYFMVLYILRDRGLVDLVVTTFLPETPPAEILKWSTGKKYPLIKVHRGVDARGEDLSDKCVETMDDIDDLLDRFQAKGLMSRYRSSDEAFAEDHFVDILKVLKSFIQSEKSDSTKLERILEKIDEMLKENETKFLLGEELSRADCILLPRLQHLRVAGKAYRNWDIPTDRFFRLWQYLKDAYDTDAFKESCPANDEIVKHHDRNQIRPNRKIVQELMRKGTTLDVPELVTAAAPSGESEGVNGDVEQAQQVVDNGHQEEQQQQQEQQVVDGE